MLIQLVRRKAINAILLGCSIFLAFTSMMSEAEGLRKSDALACNTRQETFRILDNTDYTNKPDLAQYGIAASNILYHEHIWPSHTSHKILPEKQWFLSMVRARAIYPGPIVIDVEDLPINGPSEREARENAHLLATLADWTREAVPGHEIGFYSWNVLPDIPDRNVPWVSELLTRIDAFFISMYDTNDDRTAWNERATYMAQRAHAIAPTKKIYFYLWPQYLESAPKHEQFVDPGYWKFAVEQSCLRADGIVLWSKRVPMTSSQWLEPVINLQQRLSKSKAKEQ
jgi:hypothetical protein